MSITKTTRNASFAEMFPRRGKRKALILSALSQEPDGMTAEELTDYLYSTGDIASTDRNHVKPRLTELRDAGLVEVIGTRKSMTTGKQTAVWRLAPT